MCVVPEYDNYADGIYKIRLSEANPFNEYVIIKTYGTVRKSRALPSIDDCRQQKCEWDAEFRKSYDSKAYGFQKVYALYENDVLVDKGTAVELSEKYSVAVKSIYNSVASPERRLRRRFNVIVSN